MMASQKPKSKLLNPSKEDIEKVEKLKGNNVKAFELDPEWIELAEFGKYYGWEAVQSVFRNEIRRSHMWQLILAYRKLKARDLIDMANVTKAGYVATKTKNPNKTYKDQLKPYIQEAKNG